MIKETKVIVSAETSIYERQMRNMRMANAKTTRAMKNAWLVASAAVAAFGIAVVYNLKKSVDAASDLEETASKFGIVFKDQIDIAEKNAKRLVDSYAMSTREAKFYLSSVQDLLVPMGMASQQASILSNEIVQLSADLGSFNNLPTEQVMLDIQSALVGNFETMKKYGVVLNATIVQEKALTMGLATTKEGLDAGMKAQAAYALMIEGSKAALGDMERTIGSWANQMKQLTANIEDFRAEIGSHLLPLLTPLLVGLNEWFEINGKLLAQDIAIWIHKIAEGMSAVVSKLIQIRGFKWDDIANMPAGKGLDWDVYPTQEDDGSIIAGGDGTGSEVLKNKLDEERQIQELAWQWRQEMAESELEAKQEFIEQQKELDEGLWQWKLETAAEYDEALIQGHIATAEKLKSVELKAQNELAALTKKGQKLRYQMYHSFGTTVLQLAGINAKAIFAITKGLEVAQTIASAYAAQTLAEATIPPPMGEIIGAERLRHGLMNAAIIAATAIGQMAGGGSGGGTSGGGTYISPTITADASRYETTKTEEEKRGLLTINIQGDFIGDEAYIEMLAEKISEAVEDKDITLIASNAQYAETLI